VLAVWACQQLRLLLQYTGQQGSQKAAASCVKYSLTQTKINQV
jgi:hypothetical protein